MTKSPGTLLAHQAGVEEQGTLKKFAAATSAACFMISLTALVPVAPPRDPDAYFLESLDAYARRLTMVNSWQRCGDSGGQWSPEFHEVDGIMHLLVLSKADGAELALVVEAATISVARHRAALVARHPAPELVAAIDHEIAWDLHACARPPEWARPVLDGLPLAAEEREASVEMHGRLWRALLRSKEVASFAARRSVADSLLAAHRPARVAGVIAHYDSFVGPFLVNKSCLDVTRILSDTDTLDWRESSTTTILIDDVLDCRGALAFDPARLRAFDEIRGWKSLMPRVGVK
ncbi:MAG: hypothetical protein ACAI25_05055 [Planctomycetota bacterium]